MTGIAAIFDRKMAGVDNTAVLRMGNALKIYGPDRANHQISDGFALCWAQQGGFFSQDKHERQPVTVGRWSCVFSGFLLYREELAEKLGIDLKRLASLSDSGLFLAAWQKWETATPEHVEGSFAAVVADRDSHRLHAMRSMQQAPPLFYQETGKRVVVGSMPKILFAHGDIDVAINEDKIADSLILNYEHSPGSYYKGVEVVRSGTIITFTPGTKSTRHYFDIQSVPDIHFVNDDDYVESAHEIFKNAVGQFLRGPEIPAAHLSAGLDSSAVVVTALELLSEQGRGDERIHTYTSVPEPDWDGRTYGHNRIGDEGPAVRELSARYQQIAPHFLDCRGESLGADLDSLFLLAEIPPRGVQNMHWAMAINRAVKRSGKKLLLTGTSGNGTLSFDARSLYAEMLKKGKWLTLWRELAADTTPNTTFKGIYSRVFAPNLPNGLTKLIGKLRRQAEGQGWSGYSAINPDYAKEMHAEGRAIAAGLDTGFSGSNSTREMMQKMLTRGYRDESAPLRLAQQTLHGVKSLDPMGDMRLSKYCAGIPAEQFLKNGQHRHLIKRMMKEKLPNRYFEPARGRQSADWHLKMTRDLDTYRQNVAAMKADPDMARRFDVARLERLLDTWPKETPLSARDHPDYAIAMVGLTRALNTARYINWVEGKNR